MNIVNVPTTAKIFKAGGENKKKKKGNTKLLINRKHLPDTFKQN